MFGIPLATLLTYSLAGTIVTVFGNLIALYLKEVVVARSFEDWKTKRTLMGVYRRYQVPIFLAARELSGRFYGLTREGAERREDRLYGLEVIRDKTRREGHAATDQHYFRYRFISNVYRLCSFLGWVELYRRDIGTLDVDALDKNHRLEGCLRSIQSVLADGWINQHEDWTKWRDCLVFREELRAIGHRMISDQNGLCVIDFGTFSALLESDPDGDGDARWFIQAAHFFEKLQDKCDFRLVRMKMLVFHLTELMQLLQPGRVERSYIKTAGEFREAFDTLTGGKLWQET
jgi:hypothetical protein